MHRLRFWWLSGSVAHLYHTSSRERSCCDSSCTCMCGASCCRRLRGGCKDRVSSAFRRAMSRSKNFARTTAACNFTTGDMFVMGKCKACRPEIGKQNLDLQARCVPDTLVGGISCWRNRRAIARLATFCWHRSCARSEFVAAVLWCEFTLFSMKPSHVATLTKCQVQRLT